ncbi:hypothetical protein L1049_022100 [Liquidambar formosana]|uniref:Phytocyanin domain-containing protein n=1 Tax=Liquidambar formosana TaxID=63359 RepID=A0AAP0RDR1_LIQFO
MASFRTFLPYLALVFLLFTLSESKEILVGGKENSWKIPSSPSENLNQWAQKTRFKVGDFLVWKYDGKADSVLQVTMEDYESCNTSKPTKEYKDGNTKIELNESGPFYFISGAEGHCVKGQKLTVVVLSGQHGKGGEPPVPAPAPSPVESYGPAALAPTPANDGGGLRGGFVGVMLGLACLAGFVMV